MAPQKKVSVAEAHQWIKNAIAHCSLETLESDEELTEAFFEETRPVDFKEPKASKTSKTSKKSSTSSDASERSEEGYDPERCDARACKKQQGVRFDFQCSSKKLDGECFCKNHLKKFQSDKGLELGLITEERPQHWQDGKAIAWHDADPDLLASLKKKTTKKKQVDPDAPKKPRKCGLCGEVGHTKRTCEKATKEPESPKDEETVASVVGDIVDTVVAEENQVEAQSGLSEESEAEMSELVVSDDTGAGTALVPLQLDVDDSNTEPLSDDEDDDEEEENIPFLYQGVQYEREPSGDQSVFDTDDGDTQGTWDGEKINFLSASLKMEHEKKVGELGEADDSTPQSSTAEDYLKMATKDLRKMAKTYGISADDIDDAGDTDDPKNALIQLLTITHFENSETD